MDAPISDEALPTPWGIRPVRTGTVSHVRVGPRVIWLTIRHGEIWLAHKEVGDAPVPGEPPEDAPWARWATPGGEEEVFLRPAFPDRSVVLSPERPFTLLPGSSVRIFVRVPFWIRVELPTARGKSLLLHELPSAAMSDTWWGDFLDGELAYWLPISARRAMTPELFEPHLGVCPLVLENSSDGDLNVDKLAFRMTNLSIFAKENELWADESQVLFQGDEDGSQVHITGHPSAEATGAVRVAAPRAPIVRGLKARTFARINRAISSMGGGV